MEGEEATHQEWPLFVSPLIKFGIGPPNKRVKEVNRKCSNGRRDEHECRFALVPPGKIPEDATDEKRGPSFEEIDDS